MSSDWAFAKPWSPSEVQKKAVVFMLENAGAGVFLKPGAGKTSTTLAAYKILRSKGLAKRMLVVAPRRVAQLVWPAEVKKWLDFCDFSVSVLHGPRKDQIYEDGADIHIVNYEGLVWLLSKGDAHKRYDIFVADELTRLKHTRTKRFKALKPYLEKFKRRWGLTGTPAANGMMDLFGQMYVVDVGYSLGRFITHYRSKYFDQTGYGGYTYKLREGAYEEIIERIKPSAIMLDHSDIVNLPKRQDVIIDVELPSKARRIYKEMEDDLVTIVESEPVTAPNAAAALIKCQQICNGRVYVEKEDGTKDVEHVHNEKVEALVELVGELNGAPLLVAYGFVHDIDAISEGLGYDVPYIGQGVSDAKAERLVNMWNNGEIPVLVGHPASISVGLNLQEGECANLCFFSPTFDLEKHEQTIDRVIRQGNMAERVRVYHILAKDTVDYYIMKALEKKGNLQEDFLGALKR